jgi:hypothetical protein
MGGCLHCDRSAILLPAILSAQSIFRPAVPEQNFNTGGNDVFVAKLNAAGTALVYATGN